VRKERERERVRKGKLLSRFFAATHLLSLSLIPTSSKAVHNREHP
jgi:hypothetical protein